MQVILKQVRFKGTVYRDGSGCKYVHSKGLLKWNLQRHLQQLLAFWKQIASGAHSSVSGLLFPKHSCWQRRYEQIWNLFPMAQWKFEAQNVGILWRQQRYKCSVKLGTAQWMLRNVGDCEMRPVWIHQVFALCLSSLCVSCIIVNILLYIACLYKFKGWDGLICWDQCEYTNKLFSTKTRKKSKNPF
jgi:hypothetical protein